MRLRTLPIGFLLLFVTGLSLFNACKPTDPTPSGSSCDLTDIPYSPTAYTILKPDHFPEIAIPADNPMTVEGVQLGRRLFYDPILSGDSTQSCSSCHLPAGSFTDNLATSTGIDGINGKRSAMSLINVAYAWNGLFWDGRSATLETQALAPVEDPIEMHNTWTNAMSSLRNHDTYPELFRKAFGISGCEEMTKEMAAKAIAQFERTLISSGNSKFDQFLAGNSFALEDEEKDGKLMFFDEGLTAGLQLPDAECFHCHGGLTLTGNQYFNNGIDSAGTLQDFPDFGRGGFNGNEWDNGKFRAPTLRNIALTAPYMHDGRFQTLEEVLDHYISGGHPGPNKDPFIHPLGFPENNGGTITYSGFTPYHKEALLQFLHALTDTTFINNPDIQNPF
ncbi:MAG: cytochrome c peroxidase [Saprospiraceae bacterium]